MLSSTSPFAGTLYSVGIIIDLPMFRLTRWELAVRPVAGLTGAVLSRPAITWLRSAGLSISHVARLHQPCHSDLQVGPASGVLVELLGTLGRLLTLQKIPWLTVHKGSRAHTLTVDTLSPNMRKN